MRAFTYCCHRCQYTTDHDVPGTGFPPNEIKRPHDGCPETTLKRVWMSVRMNMGRSLDPFEQHRFRVGE